MDRRDFLISAGTAAFAGIASAACAGRDGAAAASLTSQPLKRNESPEMQYRELGSTGERVSLIGLGGAHIGKPNLDEQTSIRLVRTAIDRGVTFVDNCWDYNAGVSDQRIGKALKDGYRDKVFLMTKIDGRTKRAAADQLDQSLRRMQVDTIDLVQHHEMLRFEDVHRAFRADGAQAALVEAQQAGKLRYIGFTGHKDPAVHLHTLEIMREHGFTPATVQMPLNVMDAHYRSFTKLVLPELVSRRIGVLAMKTLADGIILRSKAVTALECLHYAMSLPTSVVITGIDSMPILEQALEAARTFRQMGQEEIDALLARTREAGAHGEYELFKTSAVYDGTAQHPDWLGKVGGAELLPGPH